MMMGKLESDPAMRFTPNGNPVTSLRVATSRSYTTAEGERKQETEWFTVIAWNKLAESCNQFLTKGRLVYVEGRLRTRTWESQDGQKHYRTEVIASSVTFLDRQASAELQEEKVEGEKVEGGKVGEVEVGELEPEDIPF